MECLIIRTTLANPNPVSACSSCVALFRECSLAIGEKRKASEFETHDPIVGHLHGVNEEYGERFEFLTRDGLAQGDPPASPGGSLVKARDSSLASAPKRGKGTMSKQDIRVLKAWLSEHRHSPYPSESEKLELRATTGLTLLQISNWFANARRRQRQTKGMPIPIPAWGKPKQNLVTQGDLDVTPISRWQNSPPEDDPVHPATVAQAIATSSKNYQALNLGSELLLSQLNSFDTHSVSSRETSLSALSSDSSNSVWSNSSWASHHSFAPVTHLRRRRHQKRKYLDKSTATFQCTFCLESFKKRHDWARHEKSIHLPLEHWICSQGDGIILALSNTLITNTASANTLCTQQVCCIFCEAPNPTISHINSHEFNTCSSRPISERTFRRKDHLRQHLSKFHGCDQMFGDVNQIWKVEWGEIRSRCGFCGQGFGDWEARADHLVVHFRAGVGMGEWVGDWGFDGEVLGLLRDAVSPEERMLASSD